MAGLAAVIGENRVKLDSRDIFAAIDPFGIDDHKLFEGDLGCLAAAIRRNSRRSASFWHDDDGCVACYAGDIIDHSPNKWHELVEILRGGNLSEFPEMSGLFCISLLDTKNRVFYIISDIYSFYPIFYSLLGGTLIASTSSAVFPVAANFGIDPEWIYEYLFFSFPMGQTTIWKDVFRMPPATILKLDLDSGAMTLTRYGRGFARSPKLLSGEDALNSAFEVFGEVMPKYFAAN